MRTIAAAAIREAVAELCMRANFSLRKDVVAALRAACRRETNPLARQFLSDVLENARIAKAQNIAICQDTGLPIVFAEVGQDAHIDGDFRKAVNTGVEAGYTKGYLRNSIIGDPLERASSGYAPCVLHIDLVKGSKVKLTVLPKGFGSENKTKLKMFEPTVGLDEIKKFILTSVKEAGPDSCPPFVVGVGIGGTADYAMMLAKKALLRSVAVQRASCVGRLEKTLLIEINKLDIGPMGLGGKTTCLGVHVETYPTHIAGLPVAVNISCHALRSATAVL